MESAAIIDELVDIRRLLRMNITTIKTSFGQTTLHGNLEYQCARLQAVIEQLKEAA